MRNNLRYKIAWTNDGTHSDSEVIKEFVYNKLKEHGYSTLRKFLRVHNLDIQTWTVKLGFYRRKQKNVFMQRYFNDLCHMLRLLNTHPLEILIKLDMMPKTVDMSSHYSDTNLSKLIAERPYKLARKVAEKISNEECELDFYEIYRCVKILKKRRGIPNNRTHYVKIIIAMSEVYGVPILTIYKWIGLEI